MKTFLKTVCVLCLLFLLVACSEDEDSLPPITQTGEHSFGFNFNGSPYLADRGKLRADIINEGTGIDDGFEINTFIISADNDDFSFAIACFTDSDTPIGEGVYDLTFPQMKSLRGVVISDLDWDLDCRYARSNYEILDGEIEITKLSFEERIVSGTFSFHIQHDDGCAEDIIATEGRFDINRLLY